MTIRNRQFGLFFRPSSSVLASGACPCDRSSDTPVGGSVVAATNLTVPSIPTSGYSVLGTDSDIFYLPFSPPEKWVTNGGAIAQMMAILTMVDLTGPFAATFDALITAESSLDGITWTEEATILETGPIVSDVQSVTIDLSLSHFVTSVISFWRWKITLDLTSTGALLNLTVTSANIIQP
jgi:hypothetical protein